MSRANSPIEQLLQQLLRLRDEALAHQHRRMVVLSGELAWCNMLATALVEHLAPTSNEGTLWLAREWPEPANRLQQIIGAESQLLIFNAHHGFDPNLFGAAAGTLVGGGLLLLLSPDFDKWQDKSDPVSSRITVYPHLPESISNHYIRRLIGTLEEGARESRLTIMRQSGEAEYPHRTLPAVPLVTAASTPDRGTPDQQRAIAAIIHTATGHRHRPLVLTADRGRGKSAALGIAAAQLASAGNRHIVVTAPSRAAVANLFKHAALDDEPEGAGSSIVFIAPDSLIMEPVTADLVLVDEAAAIPSPLLSKIVERYSRVVFATTTHGYEGSGQGFALRFIKTLRHIAPGYSELQLSSPIRWADGDPVEEQTNRMLLLDAEAELSTTDLPVGTHPVDRIERLERERLASDEPLLRQLFGLLVLAHYRTTPLDLRQLLDGPNLTVYCASHRNRVVATALIADEGEFGGETGMQLARQIWLGQRRPQGHLLPQTLVAHLGIREAAALRYRRIIRIAVHPALQRQGIGRELIDKISADASTEQVDLLGTSYGATGALINFWNQSQLSPVFIGSHRSASSGTYALTQMKALSAQGRATLSVAEQRFQNGLASQLREPLQQLESEIIEQILKPTPFNPNQHDLDDIDAFADGQRRYETVISPLYQLLLGRFHKIDELSPGQRQLLILRLLQGRSYGECAALLKMDGKAAIVAEMRAAITLLRNYI